MTDDDKIAMLTREQKIEIAVQQGFCVQNGKAYVWAGQDEVTANLFDALDAAFAAGVREGRERAAKIALEGVGDAMTEEDRIIDAERKSIAAAIRAQGGE